MRSASRRVREGLRAAALVVALLTAGCDVTRTIVDGGPPVPAGPIGPVVADPAGGPPIECRGVPVQQCREMAGDRLGRNDVVRVIVTCTRVCTATDGEVRIDLVMADGRVQPSGGGGYSTAPAVPAPAPNEPIPEGSA